MSLVAKHHHVDTLLQELSWTLQSKMALRWPDPFTQSGLHLGNDSRGGKIRFYESEGVIYVCKHMAW